MRSLPAWWGSRDQVSHQRLGGVSIQMVNAAASGGTALSSPIR
jgi:hypothetical protein